MKEKKPKVRKIKEQKKGGASSLLFVMISLLLTLGLFFGLVVLQSYLMEEVTYQQIVVAKQDIPANTIITMENAYDYLQIKQVNILDATSGALTSADELLNKKAIVPLYAGEVVSLKDFENLAVYTKDIENPVEVSIKVDDISNADGGKLRSGDIINITMMFTRTQLGYETTQNTSSVSVSSGNAKVPVSNSSSNDGTKYNYDKQTQYVLENVYVEKVLDSSGIEIDSTNTEASASIIVFLIDKSEESVLNNALGNCSSMRISKVVNKPEEAFVDVKEVVE